jgi:hypothetical protein
MTDRLDDAHANEHNGELVLRNQLGYFGSEHRLCDKVQTTDTED